jgi:hypothetical protein
VFRRSAAISSIALLALLGAGCDLDLGERGRPEDGAFATVTSIEPADERPGAEFCELLVMHEPGTSVISENIDHYEELRALAPEALEPHIEAILERYRAHADGGEVEVSISVDAEAQPHLVEVAGVALECTFE